MGNNAKELIKGWSYDYAEQSLLKALAAVTKRTSDRR
jgi:hypothetical protein